MVLWWSRHCQSSSDSTVYRVSVPARQAPGLSSGLRELPITRGLVQINGMVPLESPVLACGLKQTVSILWQARDLPSHCRCWMPVITSIQVQRWLISMAIQCQRLKVIIPVINSPCQRQPGRCHCGFWSPQAKYACRVRFLIFRQTVTLSMRFSTVWILHSRKAM